MTVWLWVAACKNEGSEEAEQTGAIDEAEEIRLAQAGCRHDGTSTWELLEASAPEQQDATFRQEFDDGGWMIRSEQDYTPGPLKSQLDVWDLRPDGQTNEHETFLSGKPLFRLVYAYGDDDLLDSIDVHVDGESAATWHYAYVYVDGLRTEERSYRDLDPLPYVVSYLYWEDQKLVLRENDIGDDGSIDSVEQWTWGEADTLWLAHTEDYDNDGTPEVEEEVVLDGSDRLVTFTSVRESTELVQEHAYSGSGLQPVGITHRQHVDGVFDEAWEKDLIYDDRGRWVGETTSWDLDDDDEADLVRTEVGTWTCP